VTAGPPTGRLALFGDIHANIAALDATLAAIRAAGITRGACTGDVVLRGHEPEACVARLALLGWPCVQGNTDAKVALRPPRPRSDPASSRVGSRSWTTHRLSEASLAYLAELPLTTRVSVGRFEVLVVHGSPEAVTDVLVEADTDARRLEELARKLGVDCVVTGHTHRPLIRRAEGCLFVNPGSVGEATGGDPRPSWAWVAPGPARLEAGLERVDVPVARPRLASA
jgi:putative phosphoesterase